MSSGDGPDKPQLRRVLRARRLAVAPEQAMAAAAAAARHLWALPLMARARSIAFYLPVRGELDCTSMITGAWRRRRHVFLPVVARDSLAFAPFMTDTTLVHNRFGIAEPLALPTALRGARELDVIILPLVAFDDRGYRLGYGGGFYDRTLAHLAGRSGLRKPRVVGIGYAFQRVPTLPSDRWDVPMDAIVTESMSRIYR